MRQLRVNVFDHDGNNLALFESLLTPRDYEVHLYQEAVSCPIYGSQRIRCRAARPCADVAIVDEQMPLMTGTEMLLLQTASGCKLDGRNKALLAVDLDTRRRRALESIGCAFFRKPFRLSALYAWLDGCERRSDLSRPLGVVRREHRVPAAIEVLFRFDCGETLHPGTVVNVSGRGVCLQASTPLETRQAVYFATALPNNRTAFSVCWVEGTASGLYLAGLQAH